MKHNEMIVEQVIRLTGAGLASREVASRLNIGKSTVNDIWNRWIAAPKPFYNPQDVALNPQGPKILVFDTETSCPLVFAFGRRKQFINDQAIYKEGYIKPTKGKGGGGDGSGSGGGGFDPETGLQKPKLLGKAGAMIDAYGNPQGVAAMKKNNEEYRAFGDLVTALESVKPEDVKNSQSILGVDYTGSLKGVAGYFNPDTAAAQAKVAAASLLKQIESLPPGPASDKDMLAAKADFPGYGDAQKLQNWIDETRATVRNKMAGYEEQFGFRQRGGKKTSIDSTPGGGGEQPKKRVVLKD
jgi:hypothetical protein